MYINIKDLFVDFKFLLIFVIIDMMDIFILGVRECGESLMDLLGWIGLVNVLNMYRV